MDGFSTKQQGIFQWMKTAEEKKQIAYASVAIMVGGAVVNAPAFIGGNYLVRAFGGEDAALEEKSATTRLLRSIKRLTPNTHATAPNFSTGFRLMLK